MLPEHSMERAVGRSRASDDLTAVVDVRGGADRKTGIKDAEVGELAIVPEEGVAEPARRQLTAAHHITEIVDRARIAVRTAGQRAELDLVVEPYSRPVGRESVAGWDGGQRACGAAQHDHGCPDGSHGCLLSVRVPLSPRPSGAPACPCYFIGLSSSGVQSPITVTPVRVFSRRHRS